MLYSMVNIDLLAKIAMVFAIAFATFWVMGPIIAEWAPNRSKTKERIAQRALVFCACALEVMLLGSWIYLGKDQDQLNFVLASSVAIFLAARLLYPRILRRLNEETD
jgi:hypothetical protein